MLNPLGVTPTSMLADVWHSSFTAWTTRVSNPVCSPRFAPQRQYRASEPPSPWCSSEYLRNFTSTLGIPLTSLDLKTGSFKAVPRLSPGISPLTFQSAYVRFTPSIPNNASPLRITAAAGTELAGLLLGVQSLSSPLKELYNPKAFIAHAAWLDQACAHCLRFPTAASRRSLGRVSVPVWLIILSNQLWIVGLVGHYPTNYLIQRGPIPSR